jgi:uncharacterized protein YpmS
MRRCETKPGKACFCLSFLSALLVVILLCPLAWAQNRQTSTHIPSLEEERILFLHQAYINRRDNQTRLELNRTVNHYLRDGCKEKIQGDWVFVPQRDVITITYDEKYQVFLGRVRSIVEFDPDVVKPGSLLFKVYFPKNIMVGQDLLAGFPMDRPLTLSELRRGRNCFWPFEGTEYSFKVQGGAKVKTQGPMMLTPADQIGNVLSQGNLLVYQDEKNSFELRRVFRK